MNFLDIFLGFMTAAGGFIDVSNIVFNPQAGALFGYSLLWPIVVGCVGAAIYSEMCGRVAAIAKKPVFDLIRERTGFNTAMVTLIASNVVNILTCAAEVGGVAIILQLLSGWPYYPILVLSFLALLISTWFLPFKGIEWIYGILGLLTGVFVVAAFMLHPDWHKIVWGFVPSLPAEASQKIPSYLYYIVGLISSILMPYQVYFYSSGGIEEKWDKKELNINKITAYLGYGLGAVIAVAISIVSAEIFFSKNINPQLVGTAVLAPMAALGKVGLLIALLGLLFAIGGTAVETALAGAYTLSQFFGWEWGKFEKPSKAPRFTIAWVAILILALIILATGVDPVMLTQFAVIFSVVVFPLTYIPILLLANDKTYLGKYANGRFMNILAWIFLVILLIVAVSALPLFIISNGGNG